MNNFYYLTHDDFYVDPNGAKGPVLCNNTDGICVVLFHAEAGKCVHCEEAIPEFKKLPRMFPSVLFGMCNLNKYPNKLNSLRHNQEFWICYLKQNHYSLWDCGISVYERHLHEYKETNYVKN